MYPFKTTKSNLHPSRDGNKTTNSAGHGCFNFNCGDILSHNTDFNLLVHEETITCSSQVNLISKLQFS